MPKVDGKFQQWYTTPTGLAYSTSLGKEATKRFGQYLENQNITTQAGWNAHVAVDANLIALLRAFVKQELTQVRDQMPFFDLRDEQP